MRSVLRILTAVVLGLALIAIPLLVVHRAECRQGGRADERWSVSVPFQAERERGCRPPRSGAQQLFDLAGYR